MPTRRSFCLLVMATLLLFPWYPLTPARAGDDHPLAGDALRPPSRPTRAAAEPTATQPSAFMAGRVAVRLIFVESDGGAEPSTENWTPEQLATVQGHIAEALGWWRDRLPLAHLSFDLISQVVGTRYEPIQHSLGDEGLWEGETLARLGYTGASYFDQAYAADDALRRARHADWATTIFVVNSANDSDGLFADGMFAYAYIGGPFLVVTSDAGLYGTDQLAPVVAHEFGHIFGALDQYAAAMTPCTLQSGYLSVPTTNSQLNHCGTQFPSIMLDPVAAYAGRQIDASARGQVGYRDSDGDALIDPLDTVPALQVSITAPQSGRPTVTGRAADQPYPSVSDTPTSINVISRIEYRADGGPWIALPAADGAYNSTDEQISTTLPLYDGSHSVDFRAVNSVGAASPLFSQNVTVSGVGQQPDYALDAPTATNSVDITVALTAPAGSSAQISADPFFAGAAWMSAPAGTHYRLRSTDGTQMLYVRFRDSRGIESPPFAYAVLLDRTAPTGHALLHDQNRPWLELYAQDDSSGVAAVEVNANIVPGSWQPFQPTMQLPEGAANIQVRFRDAAGNISAPVPAQNGNLVYLALAVRH